MNKFNLGDYVIVRVEGSATPIHGVIVKPIVNDCYIVNIDGINVVAHKSNITLMKDIKYNIGDNVYFHATIPVTLKGRIIAKECNDYIIDVVDDIIVNEDSLKGMKVETKNITYKTIF